MVNIISLVQIRFLAIFVVYQWEEKATCKFNDLKSKFCLMRIYDSKMCISLLI